MGFRPRAPGRSGAGRRSVPWLPRLLGQTSGRKTWLADALGLAINELGSGVSPGWKGRISNYDLTHESTGTGSLASGGQYDTTRTIAWRHRGGANVCFFDGHVAWLRKDEIYNPNGNQIT